MNNNIHIPTLATLTQRLDSEADLKRKVRLWRDMATTTTDTTYTVHTESREGENATKDFTELSEAIRYATEQAQWELTLESFVITNDDNEETVFSVVGSFA